MKLTQKQKDAYLKNPARCPHCHSTDIEGGAVEVDAGGAWQDIDCNACGESWQNIYKLVDVEPI